MHADFILFFRNSKPISTKGGKSGVLGEIPDFYHTKTGESLTFLTFTPTYGTSTRITKKSIAIYVYLYKQSHFKIRKT
jgi:hypothetical protein